MLTQTQLTDVKSARRGNSRYGLGNPVGICGTSRKLHSYCGFFHFGPPFMAAQMGARKGCRFLLRRFPGFPTRLGCRPSMETKVAVLKLEPLEAIMAISHSVREQAAKLNPIISLVGMPDTLSQCAALVDQLGQFMANMQPQDGAPLMHLLTGAISSAINFELEVSHV